jgi:hypothetical protein
MKPSHNLLGILLLCSYVIQDAWELRWQGLQQMQVDFVYKQVSGFVLLGFVLEQWRLFLLRSQQRMRTANKNLRLHRELGLVAPVLLYAHAMSSGHAYQLLLTACFLSSAFLGFVYPPAFGWRLKWLCNGWVVVHIVLSSALLLLIGVHVYVVYLYE